MRVARVFSVRFAVCSDARIGGADARDARARGWKYILY